jgi:hypothetical protein
MTALELHELARGWVESSTEFDWDEVPEHIRDQILGAALSLKLWASSFQRVIPGEQN